jgi:peptidoglycan/xylan/chitin deacetylase (PgdA/CDA1 family)
MKQTVKKLLSQLGYYRILRSLKSGTTLLVLMYHDFANSDEAGSIGSYLRERVSHAQFEAHLSILARNCRVLSVEQAVNEMAMDGELAEDTVCITFDDGYRSVYDIAYPLLRKHDLPATVYLTNDWINGKMRLWWEQLADMIADCSLSNKMHGEIERILGIKLEKTIASESDVRKKRFLLHNSIAGHMRELNDADVSGKMSELQNVLEYDGSKQPPAEAMNWTQIAEMAENNIRFGSHTCSHLNLSHAGLDVIENEILESGSDIEGHIDSKVEGFAFPYGQDIDSYEKIEPVLSKHGFTYACTAVPGSNGVDSNRYLLLRATLPLTESGALLERELLLGLTPKRTP